MTMTKSFPTQDPAGQPITDTRRVFAGLVARNADGTPRPGVLAPAATALVTGRASMAYDVAPFIAATSRFNNGIELVANDALMQVATDPAPNANSRIDVIYVRSRFLQHADGSNLVELGVAKGLAAAIPQKPSIPQGALELGWATVPSTATTTLSNGVVITQSYQFTAAAGGAVPFRSRADIDLWTAPDGALARDIATGTLYERFDGAWAIAQAGSRLIMPSAVSGSGLTISPSGEVLATAMPTTGGFIEGLFSSRFRTYEIVAEGSFPGNGGLQISLRNANGIAGGTDYLNQYIYAVGGGAPTSVQNNLGFFAQSATGGIRFATLLRLTNPAVALPTAGVSDCTSLAGTTVTQTRIGSFHIVPSAYTGIALSTSSSMAFTGTVRVYGVA